MSNVEDIVRNRYTYIGLILLIIIILAAFEACIMKLSLRLQLCEHVLLWFLLVSIVFLVWYEYCKYIPKNKISKFSVVVAIKTETEHLRKRIICDFKDEIEKQISMNCLTKSINLIVLNQHQSEAINDIVEKVVINGKQSNKEEKSLVKLMVKRRYNLIIYGSMKLRNNNENIYVIDTRVVLLGKAVDDAYNKHVTEIIKNVWIPSLKFPERLEIDGTYAVANYYFLSSLYLVGYAAYFSGITSESIVIFEKLLAQKSNPISNILLSLDNNWFRKIELFVSDAYVQLARYSYDNGYDNKNIVQYLGKALSFKENYDALLLRAIISFNMGRKVNEAIDYIVRAKAIATNNVWMYSMAFLLLYSDQHEEALRYYNNVARSSYHGEMSLIDQVIVFIKKVIDEEPDKYTLYFALGFLYYKKLDDKANALKALTVFRDKSMPHQNGILYRRAKTYMDEIQRFFRK